MPTIHQLVRWHQDQARCTICGRPINEETGQAQHPRDRDIHRDCQLIDTHIRQHINTYPRCTTCHRPMVAGQTGTHLHPNCATAKPRPPQTFTWLAHCQQCELKKPFNNYDECEQWVKTHRNDTGHRVLTGAGNK